MYARLSLFFSELSKRHILYRSGSAVLRESADPLVIVLRRIWLELQVIWFVILLCFVLFVGMNTKPVPVIVTNQQSPVTIVLPAYPVPGR